MHVKKFYLHTFQVSSALHQLHFSRSKKATKPAQKYKIHQLQKAVLDLVVLRLLFGERSYPDIFLKLWETITFNLL